jgi:hypothetical protein
MGTERKRMPNERAQWAISESRGTQLTRLVIERFANFKPPGQGKLPSATAHAEFLRRVQQGLARKRR